MSKGITHSCANIWRSIARAGKWESHTAICAWWDGIYSEEEVNEHLVTLVMGSFLEEGESLRHGAMFAYTPNCHPLPGESIAAVASTNCDTDTASEVVPPAQRNVMDTVYLPPSPNYRPGAQDYLAYPSLHMGKRRAFRSEA